MLIVPVRLGPSRIHGIGVFASRTIPAGTVVWRFQPGFDQRFTREEILALPPNAQRFLAKYSNRSSLSGLYLLDNDLGRHLNHSDDANLNSVVVPGEIETVSVAIRDIAEDEELTEDYSLYETPDDPDNLRFTLESALDASDLDPRRRPKT